MLNAVSDAVCMFHHTGVLHLKKDSCMMGQTQSVIAYKKLHLVGSDFGASSPA